MTDSNRAKELNVRLYATGRSKRWAAEKLKVSREWLTKVLNAAEQSASLLDRVEELCEELERSDDYALAA